MTNQNSRQFSKGVYLLVDSLHGQYIPQVFLERYPEWKVSEFTKNEIQAGPDSEYYLDAWSDLIDDATFTDPEGNVFTLYNDGDLWALCPALMTDEEKSNFGFEG